ncbi:MAG: 50S ribosome-binding GTPase [Geodermatophilaceae bacterium]|nr:50S ribosome-binding GTPase [Geodermatophilaceae bacterium]
MKGLLDSIAARRAPGPGAGAELQSRLASLALAVEAGQGRVPESSLGAARTVLERAGQRLEHSTEHTVVALAGSTGSGKSSLFNRLTGEQLAQIGVRRPTTAIPQACIWGPGAEGAGSLLDWLGIERRHVLSKPGVTDALAGLVLLDLPDHDSTAMAHRLEVDRLVAMVDLMVWVVDPQKYADAILHQRYLAPLAKHGSVLLFALNHVDELSDAEREACLSDLRGLLAADGFAKPAILATSATTGLGTDRLMAVLQDRVNKTRAASARLTADVDRAAGGLAVHGFDHPVTVAGQPSTGLIDALAAAAGVPAVSAAVASSYELRAQEHVGFPLTRWLARLRPDPLRRLHLGDRVAVGRKGSRARGGSAGSGSSGAGSSGAGSSGSGSGAEPSAAESELQAMVTARTSLPEPTPAQRARVDSAVRAEINRATEGLTGPWKAAVAAAGRASENDLSDALDRAVGNVDLPVRDEPGWWRVASWLQWALFGIAVIGGLWLLLLAALGWLQIEVDSPQVIGLPLPTLMLLGGVLLGLVTAGLGRRAARVGGRRRGARAERALRGAVTEVATKLIVDPMSAELRRCADFTAAVAAARPPPGKS